MEQINKNMLDIREFVAGKVCRVVGPSLMTTIQVIDSSVFYSTRYGNICSYTISTAKVIDDNYFPFSIEAFYIQEDIIALASPTHFFMYSYPTFEQLLKEELQINCIRSGLITAGGDGIVRKWSKDGSSFIFSVEFAITNMIAFENLIAVSGTQLTVFDTVLNKVVHHTKDSSCIEMSSKYLIKARDNEIHIFSCENFIEINTIIYKSIVTALKLSPNSDFLAIGSEDGVVKVYDIAGKRNEIALKGHTGAIIQFIITDSLDFIISISKDLYLRIWSFPDFPQETVHMSNAGVNHLYPTETGIICCLTNKTVAVFNETFQEILKIKGDGISMAAKFNILCIGDNLGYLYFVQLETYKLLDTIEGHKGAIRSLLFYDFSLVTGGADSNIHVWAISESLDIKSLKKIILRGHQQAIWCLAIWDQKLFSGSSDKTIRTWDMTDYSPISVIKTQLSIMIISSGLITGDLEGKIKIFNKNDEGLESTLEAHNAEVTSLADFQDLIISTSLDGHICIISYIYRHVLSRINCKYRILSCIVSNETITMGFDDRLSVKANILKSESQSLLGPVDLQQNFFTYLNEIYLGRYPPHNQTMDQFVLVPSYYNLMHIYTYLNLGEYLKDSLEMGSPLIANPLSPLSISLYGDLRSLRGVICNYIIVEGPDNPYLFHLLEPHISDMNSKGFRELPELYEAAYIEVIRPCLPKTCNMDLVMPIRIQSPSQRIIIDDFMEPGDANTGGVVIFKENYIGIPLNFGSNSSIEYLESLISCGNPEVLRCAFIQDMVKHKWKISKYPILLQAIVYYIYLIIYSIYIEFFFKDPKCLYVVLGINFLLFFYEIFQMIVFKSYFKSVWNYIDWLRSILLVTYFSMEIFHFIDIKYENSLLDVLTILTWVRGISYFRIFDTTRYLIRLLRESINSLYGFTTFMLYTIWGFTMYYKAQAAQDNDSGIESFIFTSYNMVLGTVENTPVDIIQWISMTLAIILLNISIGNIMISLIGDAYEKVQTDALSADTQELLEMIIEVENMAFIRRNNNKTLYFQTLDWNFTDKPDSWEGKIRKIKNSLDLYAMNHAALNKNLQVMMDKKTKKIANVVPKLDKILRLLK